MLRKWNLEIVTHIQNELSDWWGVFILEQQLNKK